MKNFFANLTGEYSASAKVVDNTLILSLPDALSPVVWRMELGPVKSSALEVRDQKDGTHVLTLKTPRNDVHDIAPFATRGQAVRALMTVTRALEKSGGQSSASFVSTPLSTGVASNDTTATPITYQPPYQPTSSKGRWLVAIAVVLLLILLFAMVAQQTPPSSSFSAVPDNGVNQTATTTPNNPSTNAAGVPVSADDFLRQDKAAPTNP